MDSEYLSSIITGGIILLGVVVGMMYLIFKSRDRSDIYSDEDSYHLYKKDKYKKFKFW